MQSALLHRVQLKFCVLYVGCIRELSTGKLHEDAMLVFMRAYMLLELVGYRPKADLLTVSVLLACYAGLTSWLLLMTPHCTTSETYTTCTDAWKRQTKGSSGLP